MFVLTMPGLALLAARELAAAGGVSVRDSGSEGRSDVLLVDADRAGRGDLRGLRLAEDVFAEVGRTVRADGDTARSVAGRIWRPERSARSLSMWAEHRGPLRAAMSFRVVARVLTETSFLRTDLRRELTRVVAGDRPRWRPADPADLEVWVAEYAPGRFVCGLRLSDERMRQHGGRPQERRGALRPTVAAAAVCLAGPPAGLLVDPCCGAATGLADAAAAACVSNLPFGWQFDVPGDRREWLREALRDMARVTRPGGRVVLLVPEIPVAVVPAGLRQTERVRLRLLGRATSLWAYDRR